MTRVCTVPSKESVPPMLWGVIEWEMPDGMNARQAQVIMKAFVEKTHCFNVMCYALGVSRAVGDMYLKNEKTIPKGIVQKLPKLQKVLMRNPARTLSLLEKKLAPKNHGYGVTSKDAAVSEYYMRATSEINADAGSRAGYQFEKIRTERGMTTAEVAQILKAQGLKIYDSYIAKIERIGITPKSLMFFPLCELYNVRPELFGFVGSYGDRVKAWRKEKNAAQEQV